MRICFIGDSFVNGVGCDSGLGWVGRIVAAERGRGRDLTAYNLGVRRDTSADIAARWRDEAARRLPEGVEGRLVFSFGANDCVEEAGAVRVGADRTLITARAMLAEARSRWPVFVVGPLPVADSPAASARIAALCPMLGALAAELDLPYLPVHDAMANNALWRGEALAGDGAHPNTGGYAALASFIDSAPAWRRWLDRG